MSGLLEITDVHVRFRTHSLLNAYFKGIEDPYVDAVNGVSLQIDAGETYGLVGESGSGKTTLARSILGLVEPQQGSIRYEGTELIGYAGGGYAKVSRQRRRDVSGSGRVPESSYDDSIAPRGTVQDT